MSGVERFQKKLFEKFYFNFLIDFFIGFKTYVYTNIAVTLNLYYKLKVHYFCIINIFALNKSLNSKNFHLSYLIFSKLRF